MEHMINWQNFKCFVLVELYPTIHCSGLATHQCISEIPEMTNVKTARVVNIKDRGWIQLWAGAVLTVQQLSTGCTHLSFNVQIFHKYMNNFTVEPRSGGFHQQPQHNSNSFGYVTWPCGSPKRLEHWSSSRCNLMNGISMPRANRGALFWAFWLHSNNCTKAAVNNTFGNNAYFSLMKTMLAICKQCCATCVEVERD